MHIKQAVGILAAGAILYAFGPAAVTRQATLTASRVAPSFVNASASCGVPRSAYPTDSLKVVGRKLEDKQGKTIVPEGISIVGGPEQRTFLKSERSTYAQIEAAAAAWHINSQRLQISEANLLAHPSPGLAYNRRFANYLNGMICRILRHHEIPIVNDNTMFTGNSPGPTQRTVRFWDYMSVNYRRWPVIFDLFNEPRLKHLPDGTPLTNARAWQVWQKGGRVGGVRYIGMQALVNEIRVKRHAQNVIWVESAFETSETAQLPGHLLEGDNLMYSFHKLKLDDPSRWYAVGALAKRGVALVDGEWSEFAAPKRPWECYPDALKTAPEYLNYWLKQGVGVEAWSLQYGVLVRSEHGQNIHDGNYAGYPTKPRLLEIPNRMTASYGCNTQSIGQGAGRLVMRYFRSHTVAAPAALFASTS